MCHLCRKSSLCDTWDDSSSESSVQSFRLYKSVRKPLTKPQLASPHNKKNSMGHQNIIQSKLLRKIAQLEQEVHRRDIRIRQLQSNVTKLENQMEVRRQKCEKQSQDVKKSMNKIIEKIESSKNDSAQEKINTKIEKILRSVEKQTKENSKFSHKIHQEMQKLQKQCQRWQNNFISVFLDLMMRVAIREGIHLKLDGSRKKEVKRAWRLLKVIMGRQYTKEAISFAV